MSGYTPGPWHRDRYGHIKTTNREDVLFHGLMFSDGNEAEANGQLACAAPELLAVCIALDKWWHSPRRNSDDFEQIVSDAKAAIAATEARA
jgi:hypothetical protein